VSRLAGPLSVIGVVILAIAFASQNGAERVTLDLGLFVLHRVPVTFVAFSGLLVGMLVMLGAGVRSDLKVRSILRQRLAEKDLDEPDLIDHEQRDLFLHDPPFDPDKPCESALLAERAEFAPPADPGEPGVPVAEPVEPNDPPAKPSTHPPWWDMEHGDPMD